MIANLIATAAFILAIILIVRFWPQISGAVNRFDAQVRDRRLQEIRDRADATAPALRIPAGAQGSWYEISDSRFRLRY